MLQFDTQNYSEQKRGLLICGINWGGHSEDSMNDPNRDRYYKSFFSDESKYVMNACRYRSRIVSWLNLLGLSLESDPRKVGRLERSISQVNWLPTQSVNTMNVDGRSSYEVCANDFDFFIEHLREVVPSFILFLSADLLRALNSERCLSQVQKILGSREEIKFGSKDLTLGAKQHPHLQVGMQFFSKATVVALPHPAYRKGIADEYIKLFDNWIGTELREYGRAQREGRAYR